MPAREAQRSLTLARQFQVMARLARHCSIGLLRYLSLTTHMSFPLCHVALCCLSQLPKSPILLLLFCLWKCLSWNIHACALLTPVGETLVVEEMVSQECQWA